MKKQNSLGKIENTIRNNWVRGCMERLGVKVSKGGLHMTLLHQILYLSKTGNLSN